MTFKLRYLVIALLAGVMIGGQAAFYVADGQVPEGDAEVSGSSTNL